MEFILVRSLFAACSEDTIRLSFWFNKHDTGSMSGEHLRSQDA